MFKCSSVTTGLANDVKQILDIGWFISILYNAKGNTLARSWCDTSVPPRVNQANLPHLFQRLLPR
jgi:hypothetical protein